MFGWIADVFDTVVTWVTGATNEAVGAVVGEAVVGAASGAIVGAALAAINGDDILEGALKGAAYGGVTAGVVSSLGQVTGIDSASDQLDRMGIERTSTGDVPGVSSDLQLEVAPDNHTPATNSAPIASPSPAPKQSTGDSYWSSDAGAKVIAGIGQGAAVGAANYLAAGESADAQKELAQQESTIRESERKAKMQDNQPGQLFQQQVSNINVKDWWAEKFNALAPTKLQSKGILGGAV